MAFVIVWKHTTPSPSLPTVVEAEKVNVDNAVTRYLILVSTTGTTKITTVSRVT